MTATETQPVRIGFEDAMNRNPSVGTKTGRVKVVLTRDLESIEGVQYRRMSDEPLLIEAEGNRFFWNVWAERGWTITEIGEAPAE